MPSAFGIFQSGSSDRSALWHGPQSRPTVPGGLPPMPGADGGPGPRSSLVPTPSNRNHHSESTAVPITEIAIHPLARWTK